MNIQLAKIMQETLAEIGQAAQKGMERLDAVDGKPQFAEDVMYAFSEIGSAANTRSHYIQSSIDEQEQAPPPPPPDDPPPPPPPPLDLQAKHPSTPLG